MVHMVFMKLEEGFLTEEIFRVYRETFAAIAADLPEEVRRAEVLRNCVPREQNMDILIRLDLRDAESLPKYLRHPRHLAIGEKMNPHVLKLASFDYEEE